jgi:hypothetical protein
MSCPVELAAEMPRSTIKNRKQAQTCEIPIPLVDDLNTQNRDLIQKIQGLEQKWLGYVSAQNQLKSSMIIRDSVEQPFSQRMVSAILLPMRLAMMAILKEDQEIQSAAIREGEKLPVDVPSDIGENFNGDECQFNEELRRVERLLYRCLKMD